MIATRTEQKAEAIAWLELMGVREDVRRKFEEDGTVMHCIDGQYSPIDDSMKKEICRFEQDHNATVYLVVRKLSKYGKMDALLFVCKYTEEWEMFRKYLGKGSALSYVINLDFPDCSEMGSILFRTTEDGGIIREA